MGLVILWFVVGTNAVRMAAPAGRGVLVAVCVLFLVLGLTLLARSGQATDRLLSIAALANATGAFVIAFWMLAGWSQFSLAGRLLAGVSAAGWLLLAIGELLATLASDRPIRART